MSGPFVLASDSDALTLQILEGPAVGSLYQNPYSGVLTYYSSLNYAGPVTITYRISDGAATSAPATITINVTDTAPVAEDDSYTVQHGQALYYFDPRANDSDADTENYNDTLSIQVLEGPASGYVYQDYYSGLLTYVSELAFTGTVTILYQVSDGALASAPATITIDVVNEPPVAVDDAYAVHHGQTLANFDPRANDDNPDNDALTLQILEGPAVGSLYQNPYSGVLTYYSSLNYAGPVTITYRISDGAATSAPATITINVTDTAPVAEDDFYSVQHGQALYYFDPRLNDSDADTEIYNDVLTLQILEGPASGSIYQDYYSGLLTYVSDAAFSGTVTIVYQLSDGANLSAPALITIWVVNTSPEAEDDYYFVEQNGILEVSLHAGDWFPLLDNDVDWDSDQLTIAAYEQPQHGTLTVDSDGTFTYEPETDFTGVDYFAYTVSDGAGSADAYAFIIVAPPPPSDPDPETNESPVAENDSYQALHNTILTVPFADGVLINDADPDYDSLTVSAWTNPQHGTLTMQSDGSFEYTPDQDYIGADSFTYTVTDGTLEVTATVTLHVVNAAPVAADDAFTVAHDVILDLAELSLSVLDNDYDLDSASWSIASWTEPLHGVLTFDDTTGSFAYAPNAAYVGADLFTYTITDGVSEATGTVYLSVTNEAPFAYEDYFFLPFQVDPGDEYFVEGGLWALDADDDVLEWSILVQPENGTLELLENGLFRYTPDEGFIGIDVLTYEVSDGVNSASADVAIDVYNDVPWVEDLTFHVTPGASWWSTEDANYTSLLDLAWDENGQELTVTEWTQPDAGSVAVDPDGSFTFTPTDPNFLGVTSFTFTVSDGLFETTATATLRVSNFRAQADTLEATLTQPRDFSLADLLGNDGPDNGQGITLLSWSEPSHGTLTRRPDGTFRYEPGADWNGRDGISYKVQFEDEVQEAWVFISAPAQALSYDAASVHFLANDLAPIRDALEATGGNTDVMMFLRRVLELPDRDDHHLRAADLLRSAAGYFDSLTLAALENVALRTRDRNVAEKAGLALLQAMANHNQADRRGWAWESLTRVFAGRRALSVGHDPFLSAVADALYAKVTDANAPALLRARAAATILSGGFLPNQWRSTLLTNAQMLVMEEQPIALAALQNYLRTLEQELAAEVEFVAWRVGRSQESAPLRFMPGMVGEADSFGGRNPGLVLNPRHLSPEQAETAVTAYYLAYATQVLDVLDQLPGAGSRQRLHNVLHLVGKILDDGQGRAAAEILVLEATRLNTAANNVPEAEAQLLRVIADNLSARATAEALRLKADEAETLYSTLSGQLSASDLALLQSVRDESAAQAALLRATATERRNQIAMGLVQTLELLGRRIIDFKFPGQTQTNLELNGQSYEVIDSPANRARSSNFLAIIQQLQERLRQGQTFHAAYDALVQDATAIDGRDPRTNARVATTRAELLNTVRADVFMRRLLDAFLEMSRGLETGDQAQVELGGNQVVRVLQQEGIVAAARQWLDTLAQSRTAAGFQAYMNSAQTQAALEGPSFAERVRDFVIQELPILILTSAISGGTAGIASSIFRLGWRGQLLVDLVASIPIEVTIQNLRGQSSNITVESATGTLGFTAVGFGVFKGLGAIVRVIRPHQASHLPPRIQQELARRGVMNMMVHRRLGLSRARQIATYAETDLSRIALEFRRNQGIGRSGNVVVIEYEVNGVRRTSAFHTVGGGGRHGEFIARDALPQNATMIRLFTERQPCQLLIPNCDRMLAQQFPDVEVTFLVEYGDAASRTRGNAALDQILRDLGL